MVLRTLKLDAVAIILRHLPRAYPVPQGGLVVIPSLHDSEVDRDGLKVCGVLIRWLEYIHMLQYTHGV